MVKPSSKSNVSTFPKALKGQVIQLIEKANQKSEKRIASLEKAIENLKAQQQKSPGKAETKVPSVKMKVKTSKPAKGKKKG